MVRLPQHGERRCIYRNFPGQLPTLRSRRLSPLKRLSGQSTGEARGDSGPDASGESCSSDAACSAARGGCSSKAAQNPMRDLLKDIELLRMLEFGDYSPADKPKKVQEPAIANAPKLKLPDVRWCRGEGRDEKAGGNEAAAVSDR